MFIEATAGLLIPSLPNSPLLPALYSLGGMNGLVNQRKPTLELETEILRDNSPWIARLDESNDTSKLRLVARQIKHVLYSFL